MVVSGLDLVSASDFFLELDPDPIFKKSDPHTQPNNLRGILDISGIRKQPKRERIHKDNTVLDIRQMNRNRGPIPQSSILYIYIYIYIYILYMHRASM